MKMRFFTLCVFYILSVSYGRVMHSQLNPDILVDSLAFTWEETSLSHSRVFNIKPDGTFNTYSVYDTTMNISGKYWLFHTPQEASVAFQEKVEEGEIEGTLNQENKIAEYTQDGVHPDDKTHHGFILYQKYNNGIIVWSAGVWKVERGRLFMKEGCSRAAPMDIFYFKGKRQEDGWGR